MRRFLPLLLLTLGSLLVLAVAPFVGPQPISWDAILSPSPDNPGSMIFWDIRLPRACLAWICGVGLAAGGMVFQAMFRNPLAEPFTLGVSSGAALGATLCVRLGLGVTYLGFSTTTLGGMGGAFAAVGLVYGLTRLKYGFSTQSMLLAGVAVNFFFASLILLIQYTANFYDTFHILRWMMGGFQMTGFDASLRLGLIILPVIALIAFLTRELDLLSFGEEWALSRGVAVAHVKKIFFFAVSLMVGSVVSVCGPIGFVGLMCPHICRLLVGSGHRRLLPVTLLFGGGFLTVCDTLARTLFAPAELPVGVFTSFLGGPFFIWLLVQDRAGIPVK